MPELNEFVLRIFPKENKHTRLCMPFCCRPGERKSELDSYGANKHIFLSQVEDN
jgi:hypothetical protein